MKKITIPLTDEDVKGLRIGDKVLLSGTIYTARDAAHKRIKETVEKGENPPFDLKGAVIYYAGPAPTPPGYVIGSVGPTTSTRMDAYTPFVLSLGLKGMIGKGSRSQEVIDALKNYTGVYFIAVGGVGALLSKKVKAAKLLAYEELGPEAIYQLEVEDFPVIVANDCYGEDLFLKGKKEYKK